MKKLITVIRVLIFFIIAIFLFFLISPIFIPKTINKEKGFYRAIIQGFYTEAENSLDVVFVGDSSVYKGISPLKIWEDYGMASYNYASPTQRMWDSYYCIKEIIKYQKPKVIVLNVDQAFAENPMSKFYKSHLYDNMPMSENKIAAITDPVQRNSKKESVSFLLPIFRFHSRWSELEDDDFTNAHTKLHYPLKGYQIVRSIKPYKNKKDYMKKENKKNILGKNATFYLKKMKELCDENGVELLWIEAPAPKTWNKTKHQEMAKLAARYQVTFLDLNFNLEEIGIDWDTDTQDEGVHMNISGAEKISSYLGNYLKEHYEIQDHRGKSEYKQWKEDLEYYNQQKAEFMQSKKEKENSKK